MKTYGITACDDIEKSVSKSLVIVSFKIYEGTRGCLSNYSCIECSYTGNPKIKNFSEIKRRRFIFNLPNDGTSLLFSYMLNIDLIFDSASRRVDLSGTSSSNSRSSAVLLKVGVDRVRIVTNRRRRHNYVFSLNFRLKEVKIHAVQKARGFQNLTSTKFA